MEESDIGAILRILSAHHEYIRQFVQYGNVIGDVFRLWESLRKITEKGDSFSE